MKRAYLLMIILLMILLSACQPRYERRLVPVPPRTVEALNHSQTALKYLHSGYTDKAQDQLELAFELAPENPLVLDTFGFFYEKTGRIAKADKYFNMAIALAPRSGAALNNYGAFLCRHGKYKKSLFYFHKALKTPHFSDTQQALANLNFCKQEMQRRLGAKATWAYHIH